MSRRKSATKREILPDSKYNNLVVAKCINVVMWDGKKEVAENIVYGALEKLKKVAKDGDELTHWRCVGWLCSRANVANVPWKTDCLANCVML